MPVPEVALVFDDGDDAGARSLWDASEFLRDRALVPPEEGLRMRFWPQWSERPTAVPDEFKHHLIDLGYMTENTDAETAAAALGSLVKDAESAPEFRNLVLDEGHAKCADMLIDMLGDLVTCANGAATGRRFHRSPGAGEVSLWTRVLKARLRRLGLEAAHPSTPWTEDDRAEFVRLARMVTHPGEGASALGQRRWLQHSLADHWIARSGDAEYLLRQLKSCGKWHNRWFATRSDTRFGRIEVSPRRLLMENRKFVEIGLRRTLLHDQYTHRTDHTIRDPGNRLAIRLIQMRLSETGYYLGSIDGLFGSESCNALLEAARFQKGISSYGHSPVQDYVRSLEHLPVLALNLHSIHKDLLYPGSPMAGTILEDADARRPEAVSTDEILSEIARIEVAHAHATEGEALRKQSAVIRRRVQEGVRGRVRRIFMTSLRLFRAGFDLVRKSVSRAVDLIQHAAAPFASLIHAAAVAAQRLWYRVSRAAWQVAAFLFGKPIGVSAGDAIVVARFELDRDAVTIVLGERPDEALAAFQQLHERLAEALLFGLRLAALIFRTGINLSTPLGWVRIALTGIGLLRDLSSSR